MYRLPTENEAGTLSGSEDANQIPGLHSQKLVGHEFLSGANSKIALSPPPKSPCDQTSKPSLQQEGGRGLE